MDRRFLLVLLIAFVIHVGLISLGRLLGSNCCAYVGAICVEKCSK